MARGKMSRLRFTDCDKWKDPWFFDLPPMVKLFWQYLCDNCDLAGTIDLHPRIVNSYLGADLDLSAAQAALGDRVRVLPSGKWYLTRFIAFQQPGGFKNCNAHRHIIKLLRQHGLPELADLYQSQIDDSLARGRGGVREGLPTPTSKSLSQSHSHSLSLLQGGVGEPGPVVDNEPPDEDAPIELAKPLGPVTPPRGLPDLLAMHRGLFVGRDERPDWEAILRTWGWDACEAAARALAKKGQRGDRIYRADFVFWLDENYELKPDPVPETAK
jgi:hypothetical protein